MYICRCRRTTPKANLPPNWLTHRRCADCYSKMEKSRKDTIMEVMARMCPEKVQEEQGTSTFILDPDTRISSF